ncbi:adenosine 5'-monophosphoramidase HINT3-like [Oscarella lobularis]|uniref:adenosine 5'-monophosphoramidase HINT3-like n=1 Tax=Oscarella lobularis TaxID=121494 RepID=UPI0033133873
MAEQPSSEIDRRCTFCRIASGRDDKSELLYDDDNFVAFRDIRPAAEHHYLVVPKRHVGNPKSLAGSADRDLVEELLEVAKSVVGKRGGDPEAARYGFHWPPFNTVQHLHLHAIYPPDQMGFFSRLAYRPNSLWFVTADWLLDRLASK